MWIANSFIACYVAPMCTRHKENGVIILFKTLLILIATTFIASTVQALDENNTNLTKKGINNNSSSNDDRHNHETNKLHTKSIASKVLEKTTTNLNNIDARRNFKQFTRPDISDHSFQSLLNEYRALVRNDGTDPSHDEEHKDHQNVERLQHAQAASTMKYLNEGDINMDLQKYSHPERYQGTKNVDNIYNRFKTAFTGSFETSTMQHKFPKPSISALITGHVPKWVSVGRQAGEEEEEQAVNRFTTPTTTTKSLRKKTNIPRVSLIIDCDYNAYYCLKAFDTGSVCGKTMFMTHYTFKNYCMLDFVNCMERAEAWIPAYMGECMLMPVLSEYKSYHYTYGRWIFEYYVADDL